MKINLSLANYLIIAITVVLFIIALFTKGFTHDLLLEAGILLISTKIILMNYKNIISNRTIIKELEDIKETLVEIKNKNDS